MNNRAYMLLAVWALVCGTVQASRAADEPPAEPDKTLADHAKEFGSAVKRDAKAVGAAVKKGAQKVGEAAKHGAQEVKAAVKHDNTGKSDKSHKSEKSAPPATSKPEK
jgi:hypothetical protein